MHRALCVVVGVAITLLNASPVTAQEAAPVQETRADDDGIDWTPAKGQEATPSQEAPTAEKKLSWREQEEQDRVQEVAAAMAQAQRAAEARETKRKHEEQMRALFYGTQPTPVRVLYDPVGCDEYERTGGPIAGTVVGVSFLGAGLAVAVASNGDKALLGAGIAMAVAGFAGMAASGVVLAKRKKARYRQALAGCPVVAK
jgi:hypothetical protein